MMNLSHSRTRTPRNSTVATVVCLILLVLLAVVQVVHVHPFDTDADHCPLCIVLHAAAPVSVAAAAIVLIQLGTRTLIFEEHEVTRPWHPALFTRPPPSVVS